MNISKHLSIRSCLKNLFFLSSLLLIQSCSGSDLGKKLADSFENPLETVDSSKVVVNDQLKEQIDKNKIFGVEKNQVQTSKPLLIKASVPQKQNMKRTNTFKNVKYTPAPYRIIIRLPKGDPSAPA